jgi:hypothetical protein
VPAEPVSCPWRRFLRFSVRGLIVLVIVMGVWLGWIVRRARIQHDAVLAISVAGGRVTYNADISSGNAGGRRELWAPTRVVSLIGIDHFKHVTGVAFSNKSCS